MPRDLPACTVCTQQMSCAVLGITRVPLSVSSPVSPINTPAFPRQSSSAALCSPHVRSCCASACWQRPFPTPSCPAPTCSSAFSMIVKAS